MLQNVCQPLLKLVTNKTNYHLHVINKLKKLWLLKFRKVKKNPKDFNLGDGGNMHPQLDDEQEVGSEEKPSQFLFKHG